MKRVMDMVRVLVATDGSSHALRAAGIAARFARELREAEVTLINVGYVPPLALGGPGFPVTVDLSIVEEALETASKAILERTLQEFAGVDASVTSLYRHGDPAQEIIAAAREKKADLIIMGSRGRGQFVGLILGSVSERVLHGSETPVLIVH
jgi:nucleotide-binding universal stress UspA family protein